MTANHDDDGRYEATGSPSETEVLRRGKPQAFLDTVFSILADGRCRSILVAVRDSENHVAEFSELLDRLVSADVDHGLGDDVDETRARLATAFHHVCLPKLESAGFVEYDERSEAIRYYSDPRLESVLDRVEATEHWPGLPEVDPTDVDPADVDDREARDRWFELLASRRRRYVLHVLGTYEEPITLADLADEVAIREYDGPITDISADAVLRIYLSLYHSHVPKLSEAGLVAYDQEADTVELWADAAQFGGQFDVFDD